MFEIVENTSSEQVSHVLAFNLAECKLQQWFAIIIFHGDSDGGVLKEPAPQIIGYSENRVAADFYGGMIIRGDILSPTTMLVPDTEKWYTIKPVVVLVTDTGLGYSVSPISVGPMIDNDEVIKIATQRASSKLTKLEQAILGLPAIGG